MLAYLTKKIKNWKIVKNDLKRKETILFVKDPKNNVNERWVKLMTNKKFLGRAEYKKWNHYLRSYEAITGKARF